MKTRFAIVIGASSGIGRELVRQLASEGTKVAAVARRTELLDALKVENPDRILTYSHDVTDFESAEKLFMQMTHDLGGLDLFIYNSGIIPVVEPNEYSFEKDQATVDVNVTGAVRWCNLAAERFLNTKSGTMIGLGSVAGDRGRSGSPVYNSSKAFLHTYMEALRNRLATSGVNVVTIKPGPVDTEMTQHLSMSKMSATKAAEIILSKRGKNGEFYLSPLHRAIFYVIKRVPSPIFRKLKI